MPKHRQPPDFEPPPHASEAPFLLPFLPTKLYRPPSPPHAVPRHHLLAQLHQGLARGHKLTLVVAPAGFGKTTLVSQWLDDFRLPIMPTSRSDDFGSDERVLPGGDPPKSKIQNPKCAWLALDAADNDLARFMQYVIAAVQSVFPTSGTDSLRLLQAPQLPPVSYLATTLLSEWTALPAPCLLVLEDYQWIEAAAIQQLLTQLLDHLPRQVHLVLISRTDPPLALARLRVQQQLTELRAADLCFSETETQAFLAETLGYNLPAETVTALHRQIEGWVAGLQLATLALAGSARHMPSSEDGQAVGPTFAQPITGSKRHIMAYLLEEVLARQPQPVQTFLLRTAIVERFCASLCEALFRSVGEQEGSEAGQRLAPSLAHGSVHSLLTYLVRANLFLVPLDDQEEWYRYHHLFHDLLRQQLYACASATERATLHGRASAWLAEHGWIEEAVQHALAAGDDWSAVRLVTQHRHELLNREEWRTLDRWLALLPAALVQQHPAFLVSKAWVFNVQFKLTAIPPLLQAAASHLSDPAVGEADAQVLQGEIDALWSQHWYWQQAGERSLAAAQQAMARLPAEDLYARSGALLYLGFAAQLTGQATVAVQTLRTALEGQQAAPSTFVTRLLYALAFIHYLGGELTLVQQTATDCLQVARQANLAIALGWAHYLLGCVSYEWNELATAVQHFTAVVDLRYRINGLTAHHGWLGLAWTLQAQGQPDQAQQQVAALLRFHHELNNLAFLPLVHSFQARLALQQGDGATARRWAQTVALDPSRTPLLFPEIPQLTRAKILLAQAAPTGVPSPAAREAEALVALAPLRQVAETTHNTPRLIELLALQALAEVAQGRTEPALATLHQAVRLAQPGRFIRTFVDLGPQLAALLYQLAARGVEPTYLGEVLAAFPPRPGADDLLQRMRQTTHAHLIEPLTERECEILLRLHEGLPNKAIAAALHISPVTVKRHIANLYQKLGVNSRQQVLARARTLGLLPAD